MTDLQQADSKPISVKKVAITLLATAIFGSIVAFAAWSLQLSNSQAFVMLSIGRTDSLLIEEPQTVIERTKSTGFAAAVAARAGISELSTLLPAVQYGGSGALSARSLRDPNLIEFRLNLPQPELALKAITAIVDELIADHEAKVAPLIDSHQSTLAVLERQASEMIKASDSITKRAAAFSQNEEACQDCSALLSARALTESALAILVGGQNSTRVQLSNIRRSQVIGLPTVTTPKPTSLYRIVAAGTLAGLLAGLLLLQMFPSFFRTGW
jgi:hypothetical protein